MCFFSVASYMVQMESPSARRSAAGSPGTSESLAPPPSATMSLLARGKRSTNVPSFFSCSPVARPASSSQRPWHDCRRSRTIWEGVDVRRLVAHPTGWARGRRRRAARVAHPQRPLCPCVARRANLASGRDATCRGAPRYARRKEVAFGNARSGRKKAAPHCHGSNPFEHGLATSRNRSFSRAFRISIQMRERNESEFQKSELFLLLVTLFCHTGHPLQYSHGKMDRALPAAPRTDVSDDRSGKMMILQISSSHGRRRGRRGTCCRGRRRD